ncbi:hypothetical protein [uncultured Dialister sp.]|nr:hypothetical protein [uncultured Dialister sp.]
MIVFYRKVLSLFPFREKAVFRKACPVRRILSCERREPFPYFTIPYFLS